jgi:hypothetical protein
MFMQLCAHCFAADSLLFKGTLLYLVSTSLSLLLFSLFLCCAMIQRNYRLSSRVNYVGFSDVNSKAVF